MKKHILCFGDSNTHGYCADPADCADGGIRFNENERWTMRLQSALGDAYLVTEAGLSGRTTCFPDPIHEGLSGLDYISPCLKSHEFIDLLIIMLGTNDTKAGLSGRTTCFPDPIHEGLSGLDYISPCLKSHEFIDLLIIMLGTNDTKDRFYASAACIGIGMARLVKKAMATDCWGGKKPNILVIAPPPIGEGMLQSPVAETMGTGCVERSQQLARYYEEQCRLLGVSFLDAGKLGCEFNQVDFMHLTKKGHAALAAALAEKVPELLER